MDGTINMSSLKTVNCDDASLELQNLLPSPKNEWSCPISYNEPSIQGQYSPTEKKLTLSVPLNFIKGKKRDYLPNMEILESSRKIIFKEVYTIDNLPIKELVVLRSQLGEENIKDGFYYIKIGTMYHILNYFIGGR